MNDEEAALVEVAGQIVGFDHHIRDLEKQFADQAFRLDQLERHARWVSPWLIKDLQPAAQLEDQVTGLRHELREVRAEGAQRASAAEVARSFGLIATRVTALEAAYGELDLTPPKKKRRAK